MTKQPSAYEAVTREKVDEVIKKVDCLSDQFVDFGTKQTEMFNHMSSRSPPWVTAIISVLLSVLTGVAVYSLTH
jgi:hypothetical protein